MRLRATPPALRDIRNTVTPGSLVKALIMRSRASMLMLPSSRTHRMPTCVPGCQNGQSIHGQEQWCVDAFGDNRKTVCQVHHALAAYMPMLQYKKMHWMPLGIWEYPQQELPTRDQRCHASMICYHVHKLRFTEQLAILRAFPFTLHADMPSQVILCFQCASTAYASMC